MATVHYAEQAARLTKLASYLAPASFVLLRGTLGLLFAQSGWGKLQNLDRTAGFFESLNIPAPTFHAALVGSVELLGGVALILGVLTRLAALPLVITMVVAIVTAHLPEVEGALELLTIDETIYLAILLLLVARGPGAWSVDSLVVGRMGLRRSANETELGSKV